MPEDELARGLEAFSRACRDAGLVFIPPQQIPFERGTIRLTVAKAVSRGDSSLSRPFPVALSYNFLTDLPGTPKYPERLNEYLQGLSRRLENPRENAFMALSGIPLSFEIEWPLRTSPSGRDGFSVRVSVEVKHGGNRIANLWASISGTLEAIAFPSLTPVFTESPLLNGIRKAIDKQAIRLFEPAQHAETRQEVWLTTSDYEDRKGFSFQKASNEENRQFILRKVYWLGFAEGDQDAEVWICDSYDAEYLGTATNRLKQLAQILAAEGLIRFDTTRNFAAASDSLLKQSSTFEEELRTALEGQSTVGQPHHDPDIATARTPSAFISYSSQDNAFAERLASDLKAKNLGAWFDKWEIRVGDSLMQKIGQGIRENDYLIVVLSPDSVASEWVKKELAEAMQREIAEKRVVVLPVLYKQCQRPPFLTDKKYANFTKSYENGFQELLRRLDRQI